MRNKFQLVLSFVLAAYVSVSARIIITENSSRRFSFTWEIEDVQLVPVISENKRVTDLSFADANCITGLPGDPTIPGFTFYVGVPAKGDIRVRLNSLSTGRP